MLETINTLANSLVEKAPQYLRIAFNEEDRTKDPQPEAAHFLKFNLDGDERRMGRDLELYNFMSEVAGEQSALATLLEELVLPLKGYSREAFDAGIAFLRERGTIYGELQADWNNLLDSVSK